MMLVPLVLSAALAVTTSPAVGASLAGADFTTSPCEPDTDSVARLYLAGLGRAPELGGFEFWAEAYATGAWTLPRIAEFFVNSSEFTATYVDPDTQAFVGLLYRNVLGREGDVAGIAFWVAQLDRGMSRATLLLRFAESPENIARSGTAQPALGPFNEGRPSGGFWCGPGMEDALLTEVDLGPGWTATAPVPVGTDGCFDTLDPADPSISSAYESVIDSARVTIVHRLYRHPTLAGAESFFEGVGSTTSTCNSFAPGAAQVSLEPLDGASYGEESLRLLVSSNLGGVTTTTRYLAIRVGSVISVLTVSSVGVDDTGYLDKAAELTTSRLPTS